ncbi:MAG TPA: histidine--tRNA ligase [Acidimicrobiales bacterium]|nr:histidine--tRNA ligase [Acidimicrobiales bacterium]
MPEFRTPTGTRDIMPPESARWARLVALFADLAERAGYGLIVSPMFEDVGVFERVGESTDIVRKEMYDFEDKGGRHLALRPEGTASVVRAYIEHRPPAPWKTWYVGPNFRYERPQAGRYRQHHQLGAEAIGTDDPDVDVEIIALLASVYRGVGLRQYALRLNSIGDAGSRPRYLTALRAHLDAHAADLSEQSKATLQVNPLRVLDSKREQDAPIVATAPKTIDYLSPEAAVHFERVQQGLRSLGIPFVIDPLLVRGLDYYARTTFEFASDALESAQNAIGGGGRYDGLAEQLGGPPTPGIGFGAGIERVLLACDAEGVFEAPDATVDVWVVDTTGEGHALLLTSELRGAGVSADRAFDARSMKSQMKAADRSGARLALIVGSDEIASGTVTVRDLRHTGAEGEPGQQAVRREEVIDYVRKSL